MKYSASLVIQTSIIQTLLYPKSQKLVNFHEYYFIIIYEMEAIL